MEHLPPWLRNVPLPPPPTDADDTPDWLRGIDSFTPPPSTAARTPDWLTEPAEQTEAASIPDWLAELQAEVTDPLAESGAQTPWIGDVKPEPTAERPSAFGTADWLQGSDDEPPPTTSSRLRMPVGPTDWLRSMGHEDEGESAAQEPAAEAANLDLDSGVPDWLRELSEEEITQALATTTPEPSSTVTAANTPSEPEPADWLSELDRLSSDTKAPTRDWLQEGTANDETILATNVPEWLTPDQPLTPETSAPDLPPWLQNIAGDEPPAAPGSVRLDLPSWLLEEDSPQLPTVAPDAPTLLADSNVMFPQSGAVDQDIPAWLKTEPPASVPEASADIPTWLRELESTEQAEQQSTESEAPAWLQEAEASTTEAPDWLQAAEPPTSDVPAWLREETGAPSATPATDVPAWLQEAEPATAEAPDWLQAAEPPTSNVPAWLQEAEPATTEAPDWLRAAESPTSDVPDWLQEAEPATTEAPDWLRAAEPPTSDVPAWLQEAEPATAEAPDWLRAAEPPTSDVPAWLQEAEPATAEAPDWLQAAEPPTSDVPAWLQEAEPATAEAPDWLQAAEPPTSDVPDWLQEAEPATTEAPDWLQAAEPPTSDVPAWLREAEPATAEAPDWLRAAESPTSDVPAWLQAAEPPTSDVPDWLREETGAPSATSATDVPAWLREAEPATAEAPDWLQAAEPPAADVPAWLQEAEPATAEAPAWLQAAEPSAADVPAWLQAAEPPAADVPAWLQAAEPPAADVPTWLQEPSSGTVDTPDWLVTNAPAAAIPWLEAGSAQSSPVTEPPPTTSSTSDEFLSGAELPPWLRASSERVAEPAVTPSLSWLQRLGSREADESEAVWAGAEVTVVRPPLPAPTQRTSDQIAAVALLERLLQSPLPVTMPTEQPVVARRRLPVLEQLLALVLLLAILIGLLFPGLTATLTNQVQPSPAAVALYDQLASLGSEDVVLIAYEWGAQRVAELRPLESALLAELTDERTKLIIVSTDLQGTLLSFDLIGPLRAAGYNNENGVTFGGRDYVLLGYRPGGELALRSLALDLRAELRRDYTGQDATAGLLATRPDGTPRIEKLNDLAMIVVLADQVQDVQAWMEQIHSAAPDVPIAFLLPQEVYPQVLPYLRLPGVYAVAGQRGAIDLLAAGNADEKAAYALSFQTWSTLVFIGVLALGVLIVGIGRLFHLIRGKY